MTVVDDDTSCWLWIGSRLPRGYGRFYPALKVGLNAHRVSWEMANGQLVPDGLDVMHACDNPPCVRPDHLSVGTKSENMRDAVAKGRMRGVSMPGVRHPNHKLTDESIVDIRARYTAGERRQAIADRYKVSRHLIKLIGRRKAWRHVPDPQPKMVTEQIDTRTALLRALGVEA